MPLPVFIEVRVSSSEPSSGRSSLRVVLGETRPRDLDVDPVDEHQAAMQRRAFSAEYRRCGQVGRLARSANRAGPKACAAGFIAHPFVGDTRRVRSSTLGPAGRAGGRRPAHDEDDTGADGSRVDQHRSPVLRLQPRPQNHDEPDADEEVQVAARGDGFCCSGTSTGPRTRRSGPRTRIAHLGVRHSPSFATIGARRARRARRPRRRRCGEVGAPPNEEAEPASGGPDGLALLAVTARGSGEDAVSAHRRSMKFVSVRQRGRQWTWKVVGHAGPAPTTQVKADS